MPVQQGAPVLLLGMPEGCESCDCALLFCMLNGSCQGKGKWGKFWLFKEKRRIHFAKITQSRDVVNRLLEQSKWRGLCSYQETDNSPAELRMPLITCKGSSSGQGCCPTFTGECVIGLRKQTKITG